LFGGDRQLFESFQAACLARVEADQRQGQAWLEQGLLNELARLAHSLKSALRLLGEPALAEQAQALERCCAMPQDRQGTHQAWDHLAQGLSAWAERVRGSGPDR
jgi:HPt (histidine-containing phosphotransfer) domain-containing protein